MPEQIVVPKNNWSHWIKIDCNNWIKQFPYSPRAMCRMSHDENVLKIEFNVNEKYTKACQSQDNSEVWFDSCVELFLSFDEKGYYNFEFNCIGVALVGFRKTKPDVVHASKDVLALIKRNSNLGSENFEEITGDNNWTLNVEIPKEAFWGHKFKTLDKLKANGNVYKCGDGVKEPHFLSWNPIDTEKPNFHVPQFFGNIIFE